MFNAVRSVRDEAQNRAGSDKLDLQTIVDVFTQLTIIDEIFFVPFTVSPDNPLLGRFSRWSHQPGAYASFLTVVEIGYAAHLDEPWKRFVVCKELCHALDTSDGVHAVSNTSMDNLVSAFSLMSARKTVDGSQPGSELFFPEVLAQAAAIELLFPLSARTQIVTDSPTALDDMSTVNTLAEEYNIPKKFIRLGLDGDYNDLAREFLGDES